MRTLVRWLVVLTVAGSGLGIGLILLGRELVNGVTAGTVGDAARGADLGTLATRSLVLGADGSEIGLLHDEEYRVPVGIDTVPAHVVTAVLDAEDERYFEHGALDLRAMGRALASNLSEGEVSEGGSTITQQLVKTVLLTSKQDVGRKVREAALAVRLESEMSKREILERYLNTVYFGNGAYGIEAAAERYFQTDVTRLTPGQAILLAGLIRNPVYADPFGHAEAARLRRNAIAERMVVLGHLSSAEAQGIKAEPMPTPPPTAPATGSDYFTEYVKQQLLNDSRLGASYAERYQAVFKGGLMVHTTLNPAFQRAAEESVAKILPDSEGRFTAALVSVDPANGAVRAMVGGGDFDQTKFNLVTDTEGRQTGSSFKVFTLIAAIESGLIPADSILGSAPCAIPNPGGVPDPWTPGNVEGQSAGVLSLTDSTVQSVNCAYARLVKIVGPDKVADVARRMGVTNPLGPNLAITLGSELVTPLQMASAYATLSADGQWHRPYVIDRVEDSRGGVIFRNSPEAERAIEPQTARLVNQVLSQVVARGTGRAAAVRGWQAAGKTGSTDENADAWFVGYTTKLSTAVWMGSPAGRVPMLNVGGVPRVYGGTFPARIWGAYTKEALAGVTPTTFPAPDRPTRAGRFLFIPGERAARPQAPVAEDAEEDVEPPVIIEIPDDRDRDRPRDRDEIVVPVPVVPSPLQPSPGSPYIPPEVAEIIRDPLSAAR